MKEGAKWDGKDLLVISSATKVNLGIIAQI